MIEKIWDFIHSVYQKHDFTNRNIVNNLMLVSVDNFYLVCFQTGDDKRTIVQFKISAEYSLIDTKSFHQISDIYIDKHAMNITHVVVRVVFDYLTPISREFKLGEIGISS